MDKETVGIIGTGWVGTSVAISTLHAGIAQRLWLHDVRGDVAEGEAMDLSHGAAFYPACEVQAVPLAQMREADVVVVAAGRNGKPNESRLELLRDNARLAAEVGRMLRGFGGVVVMVSNPVDVLTRVLQEASGLSPERVIGTGTLLDTARLRQIVGQELRVAPGSLHVQVLGEHGDSSVPVWSGARLGGRALRALPGWQVAGEPALAQQVRRAAYEVIKRKGATNHAIGLVTTRLLRALLLDEHSLLTVSRVQTGAMGLSGVALSLPCLVGAGGAYEVVEPELDPSEQAALRASAEVLQAAYASLT
jgi:L-lactate dehydrogenase